MDAIQTVQYLNKYARFDWTKHRRESWSETVDRVVNYLCEVGGAPITAIRTELYNAIFNQEVSPSMRLMATAGEAADRNQISIYNCSFLPLQQPSDFADLTVLLGHGVGVGFSVEQEYARKWEAIPSPSGATYTFLIPDSIEGWALSFRVVIENAMAGIETIFDYSRIRPAGAPLKTRGGHASGPGPLIDAHVAIKEILRQNTTLARPIVLFDIACHIAQCIVSGGVRRSAMITIFDWDDLEMKSAKSGEWWRWNLQRQNANISGVIDSWMDEGEWLDYVKMMDANKSGEPGLWSRYAIRSPGGLPERRKYAKGMGPNPCFAGSTIVQTVDGPKQIKDISEPTFLYSMDMNGKLCVRPSSAAFLTRRGAETVNIFVSSGNVLAVTPEHKIFVVGVGWVEAKDLQPGDVVSHFSRLRRGAAYSGVRLSTQDESEQKMEHRFVYEGVFGEIPDDYDVHHLNGNTFDNRIENLAAMPHSEHARLTALTQPNNHQVRDEKGNFVTHSESKMGAKTIKKLPEFFVEKTGYFGRRSGPFVVKVEVGEAQDVYDIQVDDSHCLIANGIVAHNCGEQILRPYEFCNLSQALIRSTDDLDTIAKKVRIAAVIGTIQSAMTKFYNINPLFTDNSREERLLGVSLSGIMDNPITASGDPEVLDMLKRSVIDTNKFWAKKLKIQQSVSTTCVKPDGNTSVLYNTAPGIHGRYAPYYIRRMQVAANTPVANYALSLGIPAEPKFGETWEDVRTIVFSFPIKSPEGAVIQRERSAIEQLNNWLLYKKHFTETNPSVTITYRPNEIEEIALWLFNNQEYAVGISFLPADDHTYVQAPYEEITEERYNELAVDFPVMTEEGFWQFENGFTDTTEAAQNLACVGGACLL